ncbi:unnamed protein product, partial [Meganyctiphanes norvegica]
MHFQPAVKNPSNPPAVKTPSNPLELDDAIDAPSTSNTTQSPQSSGTSLSGTLAAESSEESLDELDPQADSAVELSKDPKVYSWVGVRIYRTVKLARGRSTKSPYIHIGKVKSIDARGLIDVYFYKEVAAGLFQTSSKNDLGLGISKKDIVVLKNP